MRTCSLRFLCSYVFHFPFECSKLYEIHRILNSIAIYNRRLFRVSIYNFFNDIFNIYLNILNIWIFSVWIFKASIDVLELKTGVSEYVDDCSQIPISYACQRGTSYNLSRIGKRDLVTDHVSSKLDTKILGWHNILSNIMTKGN